MSISTPNAIPGLNVGVSVGCASGVSVGAGVELNTGGGEAVAVAVAVGVKGSGLAVAVGVGLHVAVGVGLRVEVGVAVGVGVSGGGCPSAGKWQPRSATPSSNTPSVRVESSCKHSSPSNPWKQRLTAKPLPASTHGLVAGWPAPV